ncbi:PEGA domain-containing protein [bacterium]|nr:PEGA domain-containing protein [bacterium]
MDPLRNIPGRLAGAALLLLALAAAGPSGAATLDLTGPAGAVVTLGDKVLGTFPLDGPLEVAPGAYVVHCTLGGYQPYSQTVRLTYAADWQRLTVRLTPFSRRTAVGSNLLLAGLGQHYLGHGLRGYLYNAAEIGGLVTALFGELDRGNLEDDYLELADRYNAALNGDDVAELGVAAAAKYQEMKDAESLRDTGLLVAGGAIVVSMIDALLSFPALEGGGGAVPVQTGAHDIRPLAPTDPFAVHAGLRLEF